MNCTITVIDGTCCSLLVKVDNHSYDIYWAQEAFISSYISKIYQAIRICEYRKRIIVPSPF